MFLQQLEEELVISIRKWIFPQFYFKSAQEEIAVTSRIVSQEGSGWLLFSPGRFRLAVCFPDDDCAVLPEELLTYFLCQGETPSVFGGVGLG